MCQEKLRLDIRKNIFTKSVVERLNGLPRALFESPGLEVFKGHVDRTLRDVV